VPIERLIGFDKVMLAPNETRRITMQVDRRLLRDFDVAANRWTIAGGHYEIAVGHSASDHALSANASIKGQTIAP